MEIAIYFIVFAVLLLAFILLPKKKITRSFGIIMLAAVLLLEIFVFNYRSFSLVGKDYEQITFDANSEELIISNKEGTAMNMRFKNLSIPIATMYVKCHMDGDLDSGLTETPYIDVDMDAKDSTQSETYRIKTVESQIIRGNERSAYIIPNLSGNVTEVRIRMRSDGDGVFRFESITFNKPVPMNFSTVRLLFIVGLLSVIYFLATLPCLRKTYDEERRRFRIVALCLTAVFILGALALTVTYQYNLTGELKLDFKQTSGNQISQELVDAFEAGQFELLEKPSDKLLSLENPYDWSQRDKSGVSYLWDHLLYEGKYYSYYGIAPVVVLFLPYHLITGYYFPTPEAVLLFGALGILFLSFAYLVFCDLFCKKIPLNMLLCGLLICQLSSGVWYNFCSPLFYEIAQTAGFCFTCAGFWLLLRSGVIGDGKIKLTSVCLSTVCFSMAVLSRPTLALYCFAALIFLGFGLAKRIKLSAGKEKIKRVGAVISYLAVALLPFVLIGSVQMYYNYARFGSVFDFGIQYSLTINDFTRAQFHTDHAMIGFHNFLFAFPQVKPEFPYVFPNFSDMSVNGYYFAANGNAVGLFWRAIPTLAYFLAIPALCALTKKERLPAALAVGATCVAVPMIIIFTIWESGYGVRYCTDFAWQFILGALGILFLLYARKVEGQTKRVMQYFFVGAFAVALVCNFGMIYDYIQKTGYLETDFLSFKRLFDFWM